MNGKLQFTSRLLLAFSLGIVGCGHKGDRAEDRPLPAVNVRVQTVESKTRVATEDVVGTVPRQIALRH